MRSIATPFGKRRRCVRLVVLIVCLLVAKHVLPQVQFRLVPRDVIESRLKSFSTKNTEPEALVRKWLAEAGCKDGNLTEQSLERKLPPNVICMMPGETPEVIVVGAHTDHVDAFGDGVVDNWTGAALLPSLLNSLT